MSARVDPDKLVTLKELARLVNAELELPPGSPNKSTLWHRINDGVKAGDGTVCFLEVARDGKKLYSSLAYWHSHVREVGARDKAQRIADSADDTRRRRTPGKHLSNVDAATDANLAASKAGW